MALNQASLQAGTIKYDMKPFDFKSVVAEVVEAKKGPAEVKGLKMATDINVGLELKEKQVFFYVKDTGRGITDEDKKILFTEGGRGKDSLKYNVDSTGYGLSTVKIVVEAHKGKVWVDSEVGKGSTFYVKLPL